MSMGSKLTKREVEMRLEDCVMYEYDPDKLSEIWGIQNKSCMEFMRQHCPDEYYRAQTMRHFHPIEIQRDKPEWENQWVNDFQVLTQEEYMAKYKLSRNAYAIKLCRARKEYGEIYTPKQRAKWDKEYWRAM